MIGYNYHNVIICHNRDIMIGLNGGAITVELVSAGDDDEIAYFGVCLKTRKLI